MSTPQCVRCGRPMADGAYACTGCAQERADTLMTAAGHAEDAWTVIARQTRYGTGGRARADPEPASVDTDRRRNAVTAFAWAASIERPLAGGLRPGIIPPDLSASDRLADITNTVTTWARHVCEERGAELPARRPLLGPLCELGTECPHASCAGIRFRRPPSDLGEAAAWLATQLDWLRMQREAAEAFDELDDACGLLARLVDRPGDRDDRLVGMCDCGRILYAPHWRDVVQCKPCGASWNVSESQAILLRHLDGKLVTVPEALDMAGWLDVDRTREQIRKLLTKWAAYGQIAAHGQVWRDPTAAELEEDPEVGQVAVPTYRFGEIRARLAETPRRERAPAPTAAEMGA
jgi:hypothetical protein